MSTKITLAGGCFWCIESAFKQVRGIEKAESGYAGGTAPNPSYEEVCTGRTGHAEVVQLTFAEDQISVREILEIFFALHDPTQLNRQGNDIGTQYRSAVFYHNEDQAEAAHAIIAEINQQNTWDGVVVTEVEPLDVFYSAGDYHEDYFARNPENAYCQAVVSPKLAKFRKTFADKLV
ncbi:peptide-methionine (S)-S-oxide reductase [Pseudidiomarina planktonica]|uniref:Peptide methionine sulfoxide reductase MsrA n=1 Tax=Pseudidiomarina planktonica TaxID=1323738 RepID=A0A1Y6EFR6_9GAMM|nr:peptide-methionine (S)-S-oxide reductase MsrA [Pseudidiomarina planktonica]RUO65969.1 peptide-methionine (S)-S-oxide reductase [Pseudidiomarina planktonica]SMQ61434.1 peptide-methionine (S)-S-oxide reductase [Pseudidiomarina planktonica]